jgi:dihydrofolate reductase
MLVSLLVALDSRGLIGDGGGMPWHLPADLRRFRAITLGKPILMGRKTFESIGKPLPGRFNIVLTQNPEYSAPGCTIARTLPEALAIAEACPGRKDDEAMIIGGGKLYAEAIQRWDRLYLTVVEGQFTGSTYFPLRELLCQTWRPVGEPEWHASDEKNPYPSSFHVLERVRGVPSRSSPLEGDNDAQAGAESESTLEKLDLAALLRRGTAHTDSRST